MDVGIVGGARFPVTEPFAGGMEMHTHLLAEGLAARHHNVTVYAPGGAGSYRVHHTAPTFEASLTARRDVTTGPADALSEHHSYLGTVIALIKAGHDIVHLNAVHHLPFACSAVLPSIVTATLHSPPTPWLESALRIAAQHRSVPALVSVSRFNAEAWGALPIQGVIPNGVDLRRWRFGSGGCGVAWWGRLVPEKAPHLAIDACRAAGVDICLMGPIHDPGYFRGEVAPRLGAGASYLGHLPVDQIGPIVATSAAAILTPTWGEPFGLTVAEALACGTPIVGFARGALPELVPPTVGVLVTPDDVDSLAAAIAPAMKLDRRSCRTHAERRFDADRMILDYERWFTKLLAVGANGVSVANGVSGASQRADAAGAAA